MCKEGQGSNIYSTFILYINDTLFDLRIIEVHKKLIPILNFILLILR